MEMLRRAPDEYVERFRYREAAVAAQPLRHALERWGTDVDSPPLAQTYRRA